MSTLKERFEAALEHAKTIDPAKSKAGLARHCKVSKPAVTGWFSGGSIEGDNASSAAEYLCVNTDWLTKEKGPMLRSQGVASKKPSYELIGVEEWDDSTPVGGDEVELPVFKSAEFSAGHGKTGHVEIDEGRRIRYGKRTLKKAGIDVSNAAGGINKGDSNEPVIPDGSIVMMDVSKTEIVPGEFYGIDHSGEFRAKLLFPLPGGGLRVRSYNRIDYQDEDYGPDWPSFIRVIGWVWIHQPPIRKWRGK